MKRIMFLAIIGLVTVTLVGLASATVLYNPQFPPPPGSPDSDLDGWLPEGNSSGLVLVSVTPADYGPFSPPESNDGELDIIMEDWKDEYTLPPDSDGVWDDYNYHDFHMPIFSTNDGIYYLAPPVFAMLTEPQFMILEYPKCIEWDWNESIKIPIPPPILLTPLE